MSIVYYSIVFNVFLYIYILLCVNKNGTVELDEGALWPSKLNRLGQPLDHDSRLKKTNETMTVVRLFMNERWCTCLQT